MAGFDLQSGYGLGAGADELQAQLKAMFERAITKQKMAQEQQRIELEAERNRQAGEFQRAQLQSLDDARKSAAAAREEASVQSGLEATPMGGTVAKPLAMRARAIGLGGGLEHRDATLNSANLSGIANTTAAAPNVMRILRQVNPGQAERDINTGTARQQATEQARQDRLAQIEQARQDKIDAGDMARTQQESMLRLAASLKQPPQGPQPQLFFDKDGLPHALQFQGGAAKEIPLPTGIIGKTPAKGGKLSQSQQTEVENYDALLREGKRITQMLKDTGLDQENSPISSHPRAFIAQRLGVTSEDPRVDQLLQNVGYLQALALRGAAGNQRMTQNLQRLFQQHIPSPDAPGKRVALLTNELLRQFTERRGDVYRISGVDDPMATAPASSDAAVKAADLIKKYGG